MLGGAATAGGSPIVIQATSLLVDLLFSLLKKQKK